MGGHKVKSYQITALKIISDSSILCLLLANEILFNFEADTLFSEFQNIRGTLYASLEDNKMSEIQCKKSHVQQRIVSPKHFTV